MDKPTIRDVLKEALWNYGVSIHPDALTSLGDKVVEFLEQDMPNMKTTETGHMPESRQRISVRWLDGDRVRPMTLMVKNIVYVFEHFDGEKTQAVIVTDNGWKFPVKESQDAINVKITYAHEGIRTEGDDA